MTTSSDHDHPRPTEHHHHHPPHHYFTVWDGPRWMLVLLSGSFLFAALNFVVYFNLPPDPLLVQPEEDTARSHALFNKNKQQQPRQNMATAMEAGDVLVVATRFHLGKAAVPPSQEDLQAKLRGFARFCSDSCCASCVASDADASTTATASVVGVVAVDAEERIAGYDLVAQVRQAVQAVTQQQQQQDSSDTPTLLHVLPVQPWGQFAPALNALVSWAAAFFNENNSNNNAQQQPQQILFCSAETTASAAAVAALRRHLTEDTAVAGLVLPGHDFHSGTNRNSEAMVKVPLTGRTTPWNTLALWDVRKLALTGFQLVSEGIVNDHEQQQANMAGVEEVVAIAVLQKMLGAERAKAKLVQIQNNDSSGVVWDQTFGGDPARQQWHEQKMQSKLSRAERQLQLLMGAGGTVHHVVSE